MMQTFSRLEAVSRQHRSNGDDYVDDHDGNVDDGGKDDEDDDEDDEDNGDDLQARGSEPPAQIQWALGERPVSGPMVQV